MNDIVLTVQASTFAAHFGQLVRAIAELADSANEAGDSYRKYLAWLSSIAADRSFDPGTRADIILAVQEKSTILDIAQVLAGGDTNMLMALTHKIGSVELSIALSSTWVHAKKRYRH